MWRIQPDRQRIDREITPRQIVLQRALPHGGECDRTGVRGCPGGSHPQCEAFWAQDYGYTHARMRRQAGVFLLGERLSQGQGIALHDDIYVEIAPAKEQIAHPVTNDVHRLLACLCEPSKAFQQPVEQAWHVRA